jgi:hypothetical protein
MIDYLCEQWLDEQEGLRCCHHCAGSDEEGDELFICEHCKKRYSHHKYECSRAGIINENGNEATYSERPVPEDSDIEVEWCCWECMFEKGVANENALVERSGCS